MSKYIDADVLMEKFKNNVSPIVAISGGYSNGYVLSFDKISGIVNNAPAADVEPVRKWIPCSERLPEDGEKVLTYWERLDRQTNTVYGFIDILYRTSERGWYCEGRGELNWKAIAWQPLPEPPKMKGGSE